jgi:allophanate hydrolase
MPDLPGVFDIATLQRLYREQGVTPLQVVEEVLRRIASSTDEAVWISRVSAAGLRAAAQALMEAGGPGERQPLWGVPFAVKDNIDCAGLDTTAACPAFRYTPAEDAPAVARLRAAGALLVGKTNLDQFATGLNGTRSPYGAPRCVFDARYISGGSSSGSAVAVAAGQVAFALATDTAGSGRVPAAFNNLVGVKPTRGLLSVRGMVPACRSLDCISVLAVTAADADCVRRIAQGADVQDPYSRGGAQRTLPHAGFRFGMLAPGDREFFGDASAARLYQEAGARLQALGGVAVEFDFTPFRETAELLYSGPWVAERLDPLREFMRGHAGEMDPSVRTIIEGAGRFDAADVFDGLHRLQLLRARAAAEWSHLDLLLLPTAPVQYTVEQMLQEPLLLNSHLGYYTNFVNLLDCCAVAVPAGFGEGGLPFGVTLVAPAFTDDALAQLAGRLHHAAACGLGVDRAAAVPEPPTAAAQPGIVIAVVGAHLSGMPLNHELTGSGGKLLRQCRTAPDYRLYVLPNTRPPKPGLVRAPGHPGPGIELELWALSAEAFGAFVARIPSPLGIGKLLLEDGSQASGFLCESHAVAGAEEITQLGGWRNYLAQAGRARL